MDSSQPDSIFRVLVSDPLDEAGLELLRQAEDVVFEEHARISSGQLAELIPEFDALIIRSGTSVDSEVIERAARLKVIGRAGMGTDNVDVESASKRGIVVVNAPEAILVATAELTMALILAASRLILPAHISLSNGEWNRGAYRGNQLSGKTLGIVGLGRIGRGVSLRAQAFGVRVIASDPYVAADIGEELNVEMVSLEYLLKSSDIISLHAAKTVETLNIIDERAFEMMKDGVIFVNTARGGLVDEFALANSLHSGKVRAAALDVYSSEPPAGSLLIGMPNVVHTPHLGASTFESQRDVATAIVQIVLDALRGDGYRNVLNPEALHPTNIERSD